MLLHSDYTHMHRHKKWQKLLQVGNAKRVRNKHEVDKHYSLVSAVRVKK